MIQHVWSVLCTRSSIDSETNNISLLEVVEKLTLFGGRNEGVVPIQVELVTLWSRENLADEESGEARMTCLAPDGTHLVPPTPYTVDLTQFGRTRHRNRINGIPVRGSGKYTFLTELRRDDEWTAVSRVPLEIAIQQPPPSETDSDEQTNDES